MGILDTILAAVIGKSDSTDGSPDMLGLVLAKLIAQNGGIQGLLSKFTQGGLGDVISSWIGTGANKSISVDQISKLLGSEQVSSLASNLGVDPSQASGFLADYLPQIVDMLTPAGQVVPNTDNSQSLAALLPSLISSLGGSNTGRA